jgi:putative membrane protein
MNQVETARNNPGTVPSATTTDLAVQRTVIAAERTLMAWIRTAISMIGFGFTIDKFFQYLPSDVDKGHIRHPNAARNLGLTLVALGTLALAAAALQHRHLLKHIGAPGGWRLRSIAFVVAIGVVLIGLLAFYGIWLRQGPY